MVTLTDPRNLSTSKVSRYTVFQSLLKLKELKHEIEVKATSETGVRRLLNLKLQNLMQISSIGVFLGAIQGPCEWAQHT